ncbi:GMC family oxidoreductase N-terminal domain-containing protein [Mesorhizobium tamadayense]|uniref:GMC family oxidoreductase N-terminal domain-containing protein n=1 Tax=Mesorhizobium tamadayense TaxID=425306 RepID=UPI00315D7EAA
MNVSRPDISGSPLQAAFIAAGRELGYPMSPDYNGRQQEGFAVEEQTIESGSRISSARAFLTDEVRRRPNLRIFASAQVTRVDFDGLRAVGVTVASREGMKSLRARREVVLCAGAVGSPHLLKLSGIGPASELKQHGVKPLIDNPNVGANLQDHPLVSLRFACSTAVGLYRHTRPIRKVIAGAR